MDGRSGTAQLCSRGLGGVQVLWCRAFPHLADESIALAGDRANQALFFSGVSDRLAYRVDMAGQSGFRDDSAAPDHLDQIVLGDDMLAVPHKVEQQVENLRAHLDRLASVGELATIGIEHEVVELVSHVVPLLPVCTEVSEPGQPDPSHAWMNNQARY